MLKKLPTITAADTNRSISMSKLVISMLDRLETNLDAAEIRPKQGSAAQGLAIDGLPSNNAMKYEMSSAIITKASQQLVWTKCARLVNKQSS